jgi:hypothetical protein
MKRLCIAFALVMVLSYLVLGWIGTRIYQEVPPLPARHARVAPARILTRELEDELANIGDDDLAFPAPAGCVFAQPAEEGARRHDGDQVLDDCPQGVCPAEVGVVRVLNTSNPG